jgi:hypothetical protein
VLAFHKNTTPDGSYRLIGMPGHGLVAAVYTGGAKQYLKGPAYQEVIRQAAFSQLSQAE